MFFTCHSVYKTHIIMAAKLTHHGGQIIYIYIYIYIYILWCNTVLQPPTGFVAVLFAGALIRSWWSLNLGKTDSDEPDPSL